MLFMNQIYDINYEIQIFLGFLEAKTTRKTSSLKSFNEFQVLLSVFLRSFFFNFAL